MKILEMEHVEYMVSGNGLDAVFRERLREINFITQDVSKMFGGLSWVGSRLPVGVIKRGDVFQVCLPWCEISQLLWPSDCEKRGSVAGFACLVRWRPIGGFLSYVDQLQSAGKTIEVKGTRYELMYGLASEAEVVKALMRRDGRELSEVDALALVSAIRGDVLQECHHGSNAWIFRRISWGPKVYMDLVAQALKSQYQYERLFEIAAR